MYDNVKIATKIMFERYLKDFELPNNLIELSQNAIENIKLYPIDKTNRWLGFVQGYLIFNNQTTIDIERDYSRKLFHEAYKKDGINIPKSFKTKNNNIIK